MYKDTITLFNRLEGDEGDTWFPTVIRNAHLTIDRAAIIAKYGADATDSAVLSIRYKPDGENKRVGNKHVLPPKEWEKQLDHSQAITFTGGSRFDFFWLGDWGNEEPVEDFASLGGDFYTRMNQEHDYVFAISSVGGPYGLIPHFEILGK